MTYTLKQTPHFKKWVKDIKNPIAKAGVARRIQRAKQGHFGDHKSVGNGVYEMRIDTGAGYRIYYAQLGDVIYLLIKGGDKSTQQNDIEQAQSLWETLKNSPEDGTIEDI